MGLGESKMRIDTLVSRARAVVAAAIIGLSASSFAAAGTDLSAVTVAKLVDPDRIVAMLADVDGGGIPVIVEFAPPALPDAASFANASAADAAQTATIHQLQDQILGRVFAVRGGLDPALAASLNLKRMDFSPLFAIVADRNMLARLASDPAVLRIHEDGMDAPLLNIGSPNSLERIQMPAAHAAGATGEDWHVAILDTGGRRTHKFLDTRIVSAACYSSNRCPGGVTESIDIDSANDCDAAGTINGCGHGTHVAGTAAGFNSALLAGEPAFGVARDARIISINVFHQSGSGLLASHSNQIKGLERVYALRNTLKIAAVNMSLGGGSNAVHCDTDVRKPIIDQLRAAGIATVAAAGNSSRNDRIGAPACISSAIAVASSTKADARSTFSDWGNLIDLVAPGTDINASVTNGNSDSSFALYNGTSMAAPHVAGAFAALRSAVPGATVSQIESALKNTGTSISSASVTKPRINVNSALTALGGITVGKGEIFSPVPGSMLTGTSVTFQWDAGAGAQAFRLLVGSSVGGGQYHFSTTLDSDTRSHEANGLPVGDATVYVRLSTQIAGVWQHNDYTFMADDSPMKADITAPTPETTLPGSTVTFQWNAGRHAEAYHMNVGSFVGGSQYLNSGTIALGTQSRTVTGLPTNGSTVYVRLFTQLEGSWQYNDYTYTSGSGPVKAVLSSPVPGSTLTSTSATFNWTAGSGVSSYWLYVGSNGAGSANILSAGGTQTSRAVTGLPASGTLNVRLMSYINSAWQYNDYTYTMNAASKAVMSSPTPGSTLTSSSATFSWTAGSGVSNYWLYVGSNGAGSANIFSQGGTQRTRTVTGLPASGTLYVRLMSYIGSGWQYNDYTYTMNAGTKAVMSSPTPGSTLTSSSATFSWTAGSGVSSYWLMVGNNGAGSANILSQGGAQRTRTVTGLPASGTLNVRLMSYIGSGWQFNDYTYTMNAAVKAVMTWPTPGSVITNPWASFSWTAAQGASSYWLYIGTNGAGSANVLSTGVSGTMRSVTGLPHVGTLYVRLMTYAGGGWQYNDYTYTMSVPAMMSSPAPGSTLPGPGVMFQWNGHASIGNYWLYVGTGGAGSGNILSTGVTNTWRYVGGLPASGTVNVRLMSWMGSSWRFRDYTYNGGTGDLAPDAAGEDEFSSLLQSISPD